MMKYQFQMSDLIFSSEDPSEEDVFYSIIKSLETPSKEQILSFLGEAYPESFIQEAYEKLSKETINLNRADNRTSMTHASIPCLRPRPHRVDSFICLQKWEGVVLQKMKDFFLARLVDLTNKGPDEEAEFPVKEVSTEDIPLIEPGAIFYWSIGYLNKSSGQRIRGGVIRFRRLPAWSRKEIEAAKREAKFIQDSIGWK